MSKDWVISGNKLKELSVAAVETRSEYPVTYRLAKKPCGEMVLQGGFLIQMGFSSVRIEWEDLPTLDIENPS